MKKQNPVLKLIENLKKQNGEYARLWVKLSVKSKSEKEREESTKYRTLLYHFFQKSIIDLECYLKRKGDLKMKAIKCCSCENKFKPTHSFDDLCTNCHALIHNSMKIYCPKDSIFYSLKMEKKDKKYK